MKWSFAIAVVIVAVAAGVWYLAAPSDIQPSVQPSTVREPGSIEGSTLYPSEYNPAQRVCAQSVTDATYERCVDVPEQEGATVPTFSIKVAPGRYHVYATLQNPSDLGLQESKRAYWSKFVTCGLMAACPSHDRIEVLVEPGKATRGVLPHDWYY